MSCTEVPGTISLIIRALSVGGEKEWAVMSVAWEMRSEKVCALLVPLWDRTLSLTTPGTEVSTLRICTPFCVGEPILDDMCFSAWLYERVPVLRVTVWDGKGETRPFAISRPFEILLPLA